MIGYKGKEVDEWVESCARFRWDRRMSVGHMRMSHRKIHQYQGETSQLSIPWDPSCSQHLNSFPIFFRCLVLWMYSPNVSSSSDIIVIIIEERRLWTIKRFSSIATMPLCQPSCISSRHYTSPDQWCHPVGMVASNAIMWYLDVMRCKRVSGLMLWFRCIVSLLPSSKCLLPNERVILVNSMGGREGR